MNNTKKINKTRLAIGGAVGATALGLSFAALAHEPNKQNHVTDHIGHTTSHEQTTHEVTVANDSVTQSESTNPSWNLSDTASSTPKPSQPVARDRVESEYILSEHAFNPNVSITANADAQPAHTSSTNTQSVITDITVENHGTDTLRGGRGSAYPAKPSSPDITIIDEPAPAIGQVIQTAPAAITRRVVVQTPVSQQVQVQPQAQQYVEQQVQQPAIQQATVSTETRRVVQQVITPSSTQLGHLTTSNTEQQAMVMVVNSPTGQTTTTVSQNETLNFGDGSAYYGDVAGDQPHGTGSRTWPDGSTYTGGFKGGVFHGQGRFAAKSGYEYDGTWHEGQMHGAATVKWPGGISYNGLFDQNRKHGPGEFAFPDGSRLSVIFNHDTAEKKATLLGREGEQTPVDIDIDHKQ